MLEQLAQGQVDVDPFILEDLHPAINHPGSLETCIVDMLERARRAGFPNKRTGDLEDIVRNADIWRELPGFDPPADVDPLEIKLKEEAVPYKCKARKYAPAQHNFMRKFNTELEELGWVQRNNKSRWACPAFPVRKPNSCEFRQTVDYKPINAITEAIVGPMPNLNIILEYAKGKQFFCKFDFLKGFWQLPLAESSKEILSCMTDEQVYTPERVVQGHVDSALHFQRTMEIVLADMLYTKLLIWIDDLLVYGDTIEALLNNMKQLFEILDQRGLKLSVKNLIYLLRRYDGVVE